MNLVRALCNWLFILTSPVWVLPAFATAIVGAFTLKKDQDVVDALAGKKWLL